MGAWVKKKKEKLLNCKAQFIYGAAHKEGGILTMDL